MSKKPTSEMADKKLDFRKWLTTSEDTREPPTMGELGLKLRVSESTLNRWKKAEESIKPRLDELNVTERDKLFGDLLFQLAMNPATAAKYKELYARYRGMLVDKIETKMRLELSADDIIRRNLEAERQLKSGGHRVEEVPG